MAPEKEDCTCPICMYIMIEPVTMPCKHSLCMSCYKQTVEKANLCCPICRLRISVWARKASKTNSLVDKVKWDVIKNAFPEQVQNRLEGNESIDDMWDDSDDYETQLRRLKELSKPGEIRQEYEAALQKLQHLRDEEAKMEEEASASLIRALKQEEEKMDKLKEELTKTDREIAEQLQESFECDTDELLVEPETWNTSTTLSSGGNKTESKMATGGINKGKTKQVKQPVSTNLTLTTFFSPVPRGVGSTLSDSHYRKESRECEENNCSANADFSSYVFPCCKISSERPSHASPSRARDFNSSIGEVSISRKHSDNTLPGITSHLTTTGIPQQRNQKIDIRNTRPSDLQTEPLDKFIAGPSGLEKSSTVRVGAFNLSLSEKANIPNNTVQQANQTKPGHTMAQLQPFISYSRVSLKQLSNGFAHSDSPLVGTEAGNSVGSRLNVLSSSLVSAATESRQMQTNLDAGHGIYDSISTLQDQHMQTHSTGYSVGTENASLPASQNGFTVFNNVSKGSNKCSRLSQIPDIESQQTLPPAVTFIPKGDSGNSQKVMFGESCQGQKENASESLMQLVNIAPRGKLASCHIEEEKCSDKFNYLLHKSGENERKKTVDKFNGVSVNNCDSFSVQFNDNDSKIPVICGDSGKSHDDKISVTPAVDTCKNIPSKSFVNHTDTFDKHPKSCLPSVETNFISEKENRMTIDTSQYNNKRTTLSEESQNPVNPLLKVFKIKRTKQITKKLKNSTISSVKGKNTEPFVSIMHWCVYTDGKVEIDQGSDLKDSETLDKTEPGHTKDKTTPGYAVKRKHSSLGDDENVEGDEKQMEDKGSSDRKDVTDVQSDILCSKRKRPKIDESSDKTASNRQTDSIDVLCLDDVDQSRMSQEERDHLLAARLQELYAKLDKKNIAVDRFKGSKDQYMLRRKQKRK